MRPKIFRERSYKICTSRSHRDLRNLGKNQIKSIFSKMVSLMISNCVSYLQESNAIPNNKEFNITSC